MTDPLSDLEVRVLAFEHRWWRHRGAKEQAMKDELDLSATRYYQLLNAIIDKPAALVHDPVTVKRLTRLRATGRRARRAG
jgi:hypothetical protein